MLTDKVNEKADDYCEDVGRKMIVARNLKHHLTHKEKEVEITKEISKWKLDILDINKTKKT